MPVFVDVDDPDDTRLAAYRDVRERDLVGREGLFVAEGEVVLRVLVTAARARIVSLLIAEKRRAGLAPLLAAVPADVPVYVAAQAVMDRIVGFPIHRGILALGRRPAEPDPDMMLARPGRLLVLVLFGIANHDNMGGILRNAAAFGVDAVLLDSDCCDPLYRKAIRVSVGAALSVPTLRLPRGDDPLDRLARHGIAALALTPSGGTPLGRMERPDRVALLLGAEGPGLDPAVLARARGVRIPMAAGFDSLNVATSAGIALFHLAGRAAQD